MEKPFICEGCGKSFAQEENLVTHQFKIHGLKPLKKDLTFEEKHPSEEEKSPKIEKNLPFRTPNLQAKREELELLKLENEIKKQQNSEEKPDLYFKILELQNTHSRELIELNAKLSRLEAENVNLKHDLEIAQEEPEYEPQGQQDAHLGLLQQFLPLIMAGMANKNQSAPAVHSIVTPSAKAESTNNSTAGASTPQETGGGEITATAEIKAYAEKIKKGEIDEETAYKDFCEIIPSFRFGISRSQFTTVFNQIKGRL